MCELNLLQIQSFYVEQISAQDIGSQDFQDKFLYKNERHKMTLLQNLIDNQRNEGQTYLKIDILDSGTGIRIEDQVQIFDLFQKTKFSADNINQQGMGLGLTVSNLLCETLGGKMFLDWSSEGQGTKFQLFIPCKMNQSEMRVVTTNSENFQIKKSFSEVENFSSFNFIDDPEPPQQMKPEYNQEFRFKKLNNMAIIQEQVSIKEINKILIRTTMLFLVNHIIRTTIQEDKVRYNQHLHFDKNKQ
eukprot:403356921